MNNANSQIRACGDDSVGAGRGQGQLDWYRFALRFVKNKSVLDVGCGLGDGMRILGREAALVMGQDIDYRLAKSDILIVDLKDVHSKSYDFVTSIDVVEHIEEDHAFVKHLGRIAREGIFLTTPNWTAGRCTWPFHLREYTPRELVQLLSHVGKVTLFKGTPNGASVYQVRHRRANFALNDMRVWSPTVFMTRCLNRLLPDRCKIHSHLAAFVEINNE